jgi:hypothetical protein
MHDGIEMWRRRQRGYAVEWFGDQFQLGDVETDWEEVRKGESQRRGGSE